jgi:hypothetical protein
MAPKRIMREFRISEISGVDRPAQAHAKTVIMKRSFSASDRKADAKSGVAMSDGSFPIANAGDLANAIKLAGHAKDPTKARAHIKRRAQALGLESKLSAEKAAEFAEGVATVLETDPDLLAGMSPDELTTAISADLGDAQSKETTMPTTIEELTKALAESEAARVAAEEALALAKKDSEQEEQDGDTKKPAFPKKKPGKNPDPQADDDDAKKALDALPESVKKALAENDDMKKRLATLENEREEIAFGKRATALGLHETHGAVLRKAYTNDAEAIAKLEGIIKGLSAQVEKGALFSELGKTGEGHATAKNELDAKVEAYRAGQIAVGKKLSKEQAFVSVYTDPSNADLKKRFDIESGKVA